MLEMLMMERAKKSKYKKLFGVLFLIYGIIALVTPGIPGAWFIFFGLELFGVRVLWGERIKAWWRSKKNPPEISEGPSSSSQS
jgi:hypothetical protein